jgi:Zn-dependent peptidase ImmA (M78 family)/transcriptional regulator with XRE-family HTH domain
MSSVYCNKSNPKVIAWARATLNIELERAAKKAEVSIDQLSSIEIGSAVPTLVQLRRLAELYKQPVAVFFLPEPPPTPAEPKDYRTKQGPLSRETLLSIRKARRVQQFVGRLSDVQSPTFWNPGSTVAQSASACREWLGLSDETQLKAKEAKDLFNFIVMSLASKEIAVLVHRFPKVDAKAYCLAELPQTIVVSSNDNYMGSRIFSLLHELGHLASGSSGLCLVESGNSSFQQERFCDTFAAHVLMPPDLVLTIAASRRGKELADAVDEIADTLNIGKTSLLIRFRELNLITESECNEKIRELTQRAAAPGRGQSSRPSAVVKESGVLLPRLVFEAYNSDRLGLIDAGRILNVNYAYLDDVGAKLGFV